MGLARGMNGQPEDDRTIELVLWAAAVAVWAVVCATYIWR